MSLTDEVKRRATELGFCSVGVTSAERFSEAETAAANRTGQGLMEGLSWWSEARAHASADPRRATPEARSVIALAFPHPQFPSPSDEPQFPSPARGGGQGGGPRGRIAAYALGRDYHEVLLERMQPLLAMLRDRGYVAKTYVDHGWMLDRAAAARAGLGWLGKNTNLLIPGVGSYVLLAEIVTSAELEPDLPLKKTCGSCDACMRVCPTGALVEPGVLDARRCLAHLLQAPGDFPVEFRAALGDRLYGCDDCQEVCPPNRLEDRRHPPPPSADGDEAWVPVLEVLAASDDELLARHGRWYIPRRQPRYLRRNALVVLGNVGDGGDPDVEAALRRALSDPDPMLRSHAAWAAARLGRPDLVAASA